MAVRELREMIKSTAAPLPGQGSIRCDQQSTGTDFAGARFTRCSRGDAILYRVVRKFGR